MAFYEDDFDRENNPDDLGPNWTIDSGELNINGNLAVGIVTTDYGIGRYTDDSMDTADYYSEATINKIGGQGGYVSARATSDPFYYRMQWRGWWDTHKLVKLTGAGYAELDSWADAGAAGQFPDTKVECNGTAIKGYIGGVERCDAIDSDISAIGAPGILCWDDDATFDDWSAADLAAPSSSSSSSESSSSSSSESSSSSSSSESSSSSSSSVSSSSSSSSVSSSSSSSSSSVSSSSSSSSESSSSSSSSVSSSSSSSSSSVSSSSSSSSVSSSSSSSSSSVSSSSSSSVSSSSSAIPGTVCWGHDTGVTEDFVRNFTEWTGGAGGAGDNEILTINAGGSEESETWYLGAGEAVIDRDTYQAGSGLAPTVQYKTGNSRTNCDADIWNAYNGVSFTSQGWVRIKMNR